MHYNRLESVQSTAWQGPPQACGCIQPPRGHGAQRQHPEAQPGHGPWLVDCLHGAHGSDVPGSQAAHTSLFVLLSLHGLVGSTWGNSLGLGPCVCKADPPPSVPHMLGSLFACGVTHFCVGSSTIWPSPSWHLGSIRPPLSLVAKFSQCSEQPLLAIQFTGSPQPRRRPTC